MITECNRWIIMEPKNWNRDFLSKGWIYCTAGCFCCSPFFRWNATFCKQRCSLSLSYFGGERVLSLAWSTIFQNEGEGMNILVLSIFLVNIWERRGCTKSLLCCVNSILAQWNERTSLNFLLANHQELWYCCNIK